MKKKISSAVFSALALSAHIASPTAMASDSIPAQVSRGILIKDSNKLTHMFCLEYDTQASRCNRGMLGFEIQDDNQDVLGNFPQGRIQFFGPLVTAEDTSQFETSVSQVCGTQTTARLMKQLSLKSERYWQFKPLKANKKIAQCLVALAALPASPANTEKPGTPTANQPAVASTVEVSPVLQDSAHILLSRIHTVKVEALFNQMRSNGVLTQKFVSGITAKGSLVYLNDFDGSTGWWEGSSDNRDIGGQVFPFTLSLTQDGRKFISAALLGVHNLAVDSDSDLIDRIDLLVFELDDNYMVQGVESKKFKLIEMEVKATLIKSAGSTLKLTALAEPVNLHKTRITVLTNDESIVLNNRGDVPPNAHSIYRRSSDLNYSATLGYGLEYIHRSKNGWKINASARLLHTWDIGSKREPLEPSLASQVIENYEHATSYIASKPGKRMTRYHMGLGPMVEVSKDLRGGKSRSPLRLGFEFVGTIPLIDTRQTSGSDVDLTKFDRQWAKGTLFFNF